jgi:hypothetical protein
MLKYYNNKQLSIKLNLNLAKWKRWSREFLPPDPLGGLQSGYARQYHPDQAFTVCLGGYLVSEMKLSIPEVRMILEDLHPWLQENGFLFRVRGSKPAVDRAAAGVAYFLISIQRTTHSGFFYTVRGVVSKVETADGQTNLISERYTERHIVPAGGAETQEPPVSARVINISRFLKEFVLALDFDPTHYEALNPD